ncbi:hypothetical protein CMU54_03560 [Elizabethkingia anophelis]|nr:hypothetical protein [Elizabethkingia anophelis]MDV3696423.1 hypothetical protein [Elizabethkingia anophelis]
MGTDATASWSGYIFQGEVALCKAIETIISIGETIPHNYCLKLEEDEDFSITTDSFQTFQVKAYTKHHYSKYKKAWNDMMGRFPDNIDNNFLYLQKNDVEISKFDGVNQSEKLNTNVIAGFYTLENITELLNNKIKELFPDLNDDDITIKRNFCSNNICEKIKKRHRTREVESISLNTIKKWIETSPIAFTEDICWYEITKIFLNSISDGIDDYDLDNEEELEFYNKIQQSLFEFENLNTPDMINLLKSYLSPHKKLDNKDLRNSYGRFIDDITVKNVILKGIKKIKINPIYKKLQYIKTSEGEVNCYQLLVHNEEFEEDTAGKKAFQKHCEMIYQNPNTKDIDYFITKGLNKDKDEVKLRLLEVTDTGNEIDDSNYFGFKTIDVSINELNNENNN